MKIILKENIENLGSKGDIVNVAAGYGRNYLLPKNLAVKVTSSNMKMIEMEQAALKKNLEKTRISYQDIIQRINEVSFTFERKAGEKDAIFGSVSVADIKEELDKLGFEIEKKRIQLKEPIKRLGSYTVPVKVFLDDIAEIKIHVVSEGAAEDKTVPEPEAETKDIAVKAASPEETVTDEEKA
jgi:large subunit ribosomal protein L9